LFNPKAAYWKSRYPSITSCTPPAVSVTSIQRVPAQVKGAAIWLTIPTVTSLLTVDAELTTLIGVNGRAERQYCPFATRVTVAEKLELLLKVMVVLLLVKRV
jgi:hypothetical protein